MKESNGTYDKCIGLTNRELFSLFNTIFALQVLKPHAQRE